MEGETAKRDVTTSIPVTKTSMLPMMSSLVDNQRWLAKVRKYALFISSMESRMFRMNWSFSPYARMHAVPDRPSLNFAKTWERRTDSNRFISRADAR